MFPSVSHLYKVQIQFLRLYKHKGVPIANLRVQADLLMIQISVNKIFGTQHNHAIIL